MAQRQRPTARVLDGQVALVTGGGRGLGRSFALALADAGAAVAVTARSPEQVAQTAELIVAAGGKGLAIPTDVTDPEGVHRLVTMTEERLGGLDLLVNNAGVPGPLVPTWQANPADWWRTVEVNLRGPFLLVQAALPGMMARQRGRIINVSSGVIANQTAAMGPYAAAKAGLSHWTNCLALEIQGYGIAVFSYAPGLVRTAMVDYALHASEVDPSIRQRFRTNLEQGRDTPIALATERFMVLATGQLDALTGRHISVSDDPAELMKRTEEIRSADLFTLRVMR